MHSERSLIYLTPTAASSGSGQHQKEGTTMTLATDAHRLELDRRLDAAGWGLFFLMSGALLLIPGVPDGTWLAGVGAILLGFSAVRWMTGLTMSWFAVIFGVVALASGAGAIVGVSVPGFALLLISCGL